MAKVALETVGCRLNQYETEQMASRLIEMGMQRVSYKDKADLYILNSCTVTGRADADCRKLINRARRRNGKAIVVVTGCYVVAQPEQITDLNAVDLALRNDEKMRLPEILYNKFPKLFPLQEVGTDKSPALVGGKVVGKEAPASANRALVKIGDGCNQSCSYCIVPRVRGRLASNPPEQIINEIKELIDDDYHEVVLTAVHIGRYKYDGLNLSGLVRHILSETNLSRLRLSSLEPNEMDDQLLAFVAEHPRVCRHLHLPLQSGSNRILEMMRRPYNREEYLKQVEKIKRANPDITIGCDIIVGFPGENEDDFQHSLGVLDSGFIDYGHIFSYSDRPGTQASELPDKINPGAIKERNRQARELSEKNRRRQMVSQIGKTMGVISEQNPNLHKNFYAVSDNYLKVLLPKAAGGARHVVDFRPAKLVGDYLEGEVVRK